MTPLKAREWMTLRAALILLASTKSIPDAHNKDCVPQNCALRFVIANTVLRVKEGTSLSFSAHWGVPAREKGFPQSIP
jgi:hypothetical protein